MSIGTLSSLWAQHQTSAAARNSASDATSQSTQDWLNTLLGATGTPANGTGDTNSTSTLSDQMQAMLVQLQGGNTTAPDGSTSASAGSSTGDAASTAQAASGHHHHRHHGGSQDVDQTSNDLAADAAGGLTGADTSGLDNGSGSFLQSVKDVLTTVGSAAAKGAAAGAVMAAL